MDIKDILSVGLTAEDFDTIIDGVDAIPEKGMAAHLMVDVMTALITPENRQEDHKAKVMARYREMDRKAKMQKDDLTILKSKLILLKRLLLTNPAVQAATDIANTPPANR